jgi:hypothetical protein
MCGMPREWNGAISTLDTSCRQGDLRASTAGTASQRFANLPAHRVCFSLFQASLRCKTCQANYRAQGPLHARHSGQRPRLNAASPHSEAPACPA